MLFAAMKGSQTIIPAPKKLLKAFGERDLLIVALIDSEREKRK